MKTTTKLLRYPLPEVALGDEIRIRFGKTSINNCTYYVRGWIDGRLVLRRRVAAHNVWSYEVVDGLWWNWHSHHAKIKKAGNGSWSKPYKRELIIPTFASITAKKEQRVKNNLLTASQVSAESGVSMSTVFRYKTDGLLDEFMVGEGRNARFRRGAIAQVRKLQKEGLAMRGKRHGLGLGNLKFRG